MDKTIPFHAPLKKVTLMRVMKCIEIIIKSKSVVVFKESHLLVSLYINDIVNEQSKEVEMRKVREQTC